MKKLPLTRAERMAFERPDGSVILCPPCTRGQMREVLALDREDTPDIGERRGRQVAVFLRDAQWFQSDGTTPAGSLQELLDDLRVDEETDILHALAAAHHGYRPETAVELQQAMREMLKKKLATISRKP